ncbi:hypothetical protein OUZ56_029623 [Daphnia magna]|uniref:Integrase zinc-binding domain-containing protein n=1 Tax=Daphnia magna TaxID=35525 RepID=A0ABR0B7S8_9CRUS|nr:hypothetical protein OUZ56_029623 [Daphnia magna]
MAELPIFNYKVPEKFLGTSKENVIEWIDRFEMICRHNHWTNNDLARAIEVSLKGAAFKMIVDLGREMLTWIIGRTVWFKRPRRMASRRTKGMLLSLTLYERLHVLGIKSCEEFLKEVRLHPKAFKTAYERKWTKVYSRFVKCCKSCQTRKPDQDKKKGMMDGDNEIRCGRTDRHRSPWSIFTSSKGNLNVIVSVDYLTKCVETWALSDATALQKATFFVEYIFLRR